MAQLPPFISATQRSHAAQPTRRLSARQALQGLNTFDTLSLEEMDAVVAKGIQLGAMTSVLGGLAALTIRIFKGFNSHLAIIAVAAVGLVAIWAVWCRLLEKPEPPIYALAAYTEAVSAETGE